MIASVTGNVRALRGSYCVIEAGGVGYKVAGTRETLARLSLGADARLWTHLAVREDSMDLYGFAEEDELAFFELLVTVPSVGPKSALAILNVASAATLRSAIAAGNDGYLTSVSGIGKKTAQKILLELKDKVGAGSASAAAQLVSDEDALAAMQALGYTLHEARETLKKVPASVEGSRERLRHALKIVGNA